MTIQPPINSLQYKTPYYTPRRTTRYIVIHHAAAEYPPGGALQAIYNYHKKQWPDYAGIGYHIVIQEEHDGNLTPHLVNLAEQVGAHTLGYNYEAFGICAATNLTNGVSAAWWDALINMAAYWQKHYPNAAIIGHQEKRDTSCPGSWWQKLKSDFLRDVEIKMNEDPFLLWEQAGFPISEVQRGWAIPQAWLQAQELGAPTSYEVYLNSFQSFQGFSEGTLYYNAESNLVTKLS